MLFGASAIFLVGALAMGLLISTVTRNQFVAGQVAIVSGFLPAFMLSGFVFEIGSMPGWIQVLTHVVAARYFVSTLQTVFLAGDIWPVILPDLGRHDPDRSSCSWPRLRPAPASGWTD